MNRPVVPTRMQEHAFLCSVLYASVFDYPLTADQLHEGLIGIETEPSLIDAWYAGSCTLRRAIEFRDGYFFPRGRTQFLEMRRQREEISRAMLAELGGPLRLVLSMPFVRMVALTGSLAHLNANREADLDLFVITKPGRVWGVTTTLLILARVLGCRERLCLNYIVSERQLTVEPRDLFSANQIVHLHPLCGAEVYARFLRANRFIADYYPNFRPRQVNAKTQGWMRRAAEWVLEWSVAGLYERCCRIVYGAHLKRRAHLWQSHDQVRIEPECLKLHTSSHRRTVMEKFGRAIAAAESLTPEAAVLARAAP